VLGAQSGIAKVGRLWSMTMSEHLGFIGVGRMGGPMAGRLLDAGHRLTVFDTNRGATAPLIGRGAVATG